MKKLIISACLFFMITICLLVVITWNHRVEKQMRNVASFLKTKEKVTWDLLNKTLATVGHLQQQVILRKGEIQALEVAVNGEDVDETSEKVFACHGRQKQLEDEIAAINLEKNDVDAVWKRHRAAWEEKIVELKDELSRKSKVCDFVDKTLKAARNLCRHSSAKSSTQSVRKRTREPAVLAA